MSSSVSVDNNEKDILILGEGPTQRSDDTTLTADAKYPINFTQSGRRFVLSLHYNGSNSISIQSKKLRNRYYLGNISKDFTTNNLKKQD